LMFTRLSTKEKSFKQYFNSMRFSFWYILFLILLQHVCVSMESQSSIVPTIRAQEKQYSRHNWQYPQDSKANEWQYSQAKEQYSQDSLSSNWSNVINNTKQNNFLPQSTRRAKRSFFIAEEDQDGEKEKDAKEEQGRNQLKLLHRSSTVCNLISDVNISNLKTYICNIKSFINFFCFSCLGYFLVSKKDPCLVLRHESCPSVADNIIEIFLDITHFEKIFISVICSCTFYQSKKIQDWMGNTTPILIGMENITKLFELTLIQIGMWQNISNLIGMEYTATLFSITSSSIFKKSLIILGKMFFSLENKTKRKLVLNLEALCKECDFQTWQKFLSPTQILSWSIFLPLTLLGVTTSDYFEKELLPDISTFHYYFPLHTFGVEIDNFMIIFVEHMLIKMFPDWLIFYLLPLIIPKLWKYIVKIFTSILEIYFDFPGTDKIN